MLRYYKAFCAFIMIFIKSPTKVPLGYKSKVASKAAACHASMAAGSGSGLL